ncbi:MAG: fasciclin domain-containing protein [Thaumarchaeota archaeon]|nr:fasciclin domain-containing protein [Nitrososphaerota archaeon]
MSSTTTIPTETTAQTKMSDIFETSKSNGEFKTLMQAVEKAGLAESLKSSGQYTVFAPTDEAFKNLPAGTLDAWMKDLPKLRSILNYHIVDRKINAKQINDMTMDGRTPTLNTLQGSAITIKTNLTQQSWVTSKYSVYANDAKIVRPEIETTNGIIQVIDRVLLPVSS